MRALLQRVMRAQVSVGEREVAAIGRGLLVFLGVGAEDTAHDADRLWTKVRKLRIFDDEAGKTNLSLADVQGEVLVVSQFTLYANCRKGNRPSFTDAKEPVGAEELYRYFSWLVTRDLGHVETGEFGAEMLVTLSNHGPFTIWLDTDDLH